MKIKFKDIPTNTAGKIPKVNDPATDFVLVDENLRDVSLTELLGPKIILNIFPSLDTGVCALTLRKFNQMATNLSDVKVLCISKDLPFAQKRFCVAEGIDKVTTLSDIRPKSKFGKDYGVLIKDGVLSGLFARAVVVISGNGKIIYSEICPEITEEPNYSAILKSVS